MPESQFRTRIAEAQSILATIAGQPVNDIEKVRPRSYWPYPPSAKQPLDFEPDGG
jgi:hypothetical protein